MLPATEELPVEWALLEPSDELDGWLGVPADTHPAVGPGDVRGGAGEGAEPLVLRCRFAAPLSSRLIGSGRRTGALSEEALRRSVHTVRAHRRGLLDPPPSALETAEDMEYRAWERDVPARAAQIVRTIRGERPHLDDGLPHAERPHRLAPLAALAATLALVCVGLSVWSWQLREDLASASAPVLVGMTNEVPVGTNLRAPIIIQARPGEEHLLIFVLLENEIADHSRYRIELDTPQGRTLWASGVVQRGALAELNLLVPRRFLGDHRQFQLSLYGVESEGEHLLATASLLLEEASASRAAPSEFFASVNEGIRL